MTTSRTALRRPVALLTGAIALTVAVGGCTQTDSGTAVRADAVTTLSTAPTASIQSGSGQSGSGQSGSADSTSLTPATDIPESSEPGVLETTQQPIPANSTTCAPPTATPPTAAPPTATHPTGAAIADPAAPRISMTLPDGWSTSPGADAVALRLIGPAQMTGDISIRSTPLDAAAAFSKFSDDAMAKYPISTVSILPAEICGYSGQKLMGTWADDPDRSLQYYDRIAHIWTNSKNYLVAIHVQAPSKTAGFEEAAAVITGDFGVVIP